MSGFIRPELWGRYARWIEPALVAVVAFVGLRILWRGYLHANLVAEAIGLVITLIGLAAFWAAFRRAQFRNDESGPGLVEVTERQITYLTASNGDSIDIAAMTRLEIRSGLRPGKVWVLKQSGGPTLFIPTDAVGADKLFDAFSALPGIDVASLIAAQNAKTDQRVVIWRASDRFRTLT